MLTALTFAAMLQSSKPEVWTDKVPGHLVEWKMVRVPAGKLTIDGKEVEVKSFSIAETELTWDVYDIFAYRLDMSDEDQAAGVDLKLRPSKPYGAPDRGYGHVGFPVIGLTEESAKRFCEWVSKKTGKKYRLPTAAEWEYAARATVKDGAYDSIDDYAWHWDNIEQTSAVAKKKPNAWGLYDMLGNVSEWVMLPDGKGTTAGGHFYTKPADLNFSLREPYRPEWQARDAQIPKSKWWLADADFVGMRLVCED